jgi:hypothetical protein
MKTTVTYIECERFISTLNSWPHSGAQIFIEKKKINFYVY